MFTYILTQSCLLHDDMVFASRAAEDALSDTGDQYVGRWTIEAATEAFVLSISRSDGEEAPDGEQVIGGSAANTPLRLARIDRQRIWESGDRDLRVIAAPDDMGEAA